MVFEEDFSVVKRKTISEKCFERDLFEYFNSIEFVNFLCNFYGRALDFKSLSLSFVEQKYLTEGGQLGNFVTFSVEESSKLVTMYQRIRFCDCLIVHDSALIVSETGKLSKIDAAMIERFIVSCQKASVIDQQFSVRPVFDGFLFGAHVSPYHQVYDSIGMVKYLDEAGKGVSVNVVKENSFFASRVMPGNCREVDIESVLTHKSEKIMFTAAPVATHLETFSYVEKAARSVMERLEAEKTYMSDGKRYIWVGACAQKREWVEFLEFVDILIDHLNRNDLKYYIYFDGMTSLAEGDRVKISADEARLVRDISDIAESKMFDRYAFGSGLRFNEKFKYILSSDFYISNCLTDSMWPSLFGGVPGIVHGALVSYRPAKRLHYLESSVFVPSDLVSDIPSKKSEYHYVSYSISPNVVYDMFRDFSRNN